MLLDLPWWIDRLAEAAVGQVRLGGGGRGGSRREPFKGEDQAIARCKACGHPEHEVGACRAWIDELAEPCTCDDYEPVTQQDALRRQFLAAGRVNARASERQDVVRNSLSTWIRHLCETHGADVPDVSSAGTMALMLAHHVHAIAGDETAGECFADIESQKIAIEKVVNRPVPWRFLGACPTWDETTRTVCGNELRAREDAIEVTCKACRQTHNVARLQLLLINDLERKKLTVEKILELNKILPDEYRIPERTLRHWRQCGKLKPRGYRRGGPDGPLVVNRHDSRDVPVYLWADVRRLRAERSKVGRTS
jgi:hypothetical protein